MRYSQSGTGHPHTEQRSAYQGISPADDPPESFLHSPIHTEVRTRLMLCFRICPGLQLFACSSLKLPLPIHITEMMNNYIY